MLSFDPSLNLNETKDGTDEVIVTEPIDSAVEVIDGG